MKLPRLSQVVECIGVAVKNKKKVDPKAAPGTTPPGPRMFCYLEVLNLLDQRQDLFHLSFSQFVTAEDGVMGLAQYGNSAGMRISFAKDPISVLRQQCKEKEMELIEGDQRAT